MEAEFTDLRDAGGESLLKADIQFADWIKQTYLSSGSLLARGCRSAVELADHRDDQKEAAASFGENMAYLQQVNIDNVVITCDRFWSNNFFYVSSCNNKAGVHGIAFCFPKVN